MSDTDPYSGPLAGIHAGLTASTTPFSFIVAGDHPFLSTNLITAMAISAGLGAVNTTCAVIPHTKGKTPTPSSRYIPPEVLGSSFCTGTIKGGDIPA
ncbi:MAG: hypothetical protein CM1200mP39_20770 [Dehalococcoidia bacterium]|nr:MAG: hypothetical protein CM1200mP39_20770 [Dehalococcoidia bacterium]